MNDADYIESIARHNDRQEILCRRDGLFEAAQWYQWSAARVRDRQPVPATRGCGGSSLSLLLSDGLLSVSGDMDPDDMRTAGQYLIDTANDEAMGPFVATAKTLAGQLQAMIAMYNVVKTASHVITEG
jgi:hypothetical protein